MTIHDSSNSVVPSGGDRKRRRRIDRPSGLILLLLSCVVLLSLLPLAWWFSIASQDTAGLRSPTSLGEVWLPRGFFLVENFKKALDYIDLRRVVTNSIVVCTAITAVEVFLSTLAGYAFAHLTFRGRRHLYASIVLMLSVPQLVLIIPLFQIVADLRLVDTYPGLILPFLVTPFGVYTMTQLLRGLPHSLLDAARIDGANEVAIFFRIVVPLSLNAMITLGILVFFLQFDNLLWPLIVATDESMYTVPVGIQAMSSDISTPFNAMYAVSLFIAVPFILIYLLAQRRVMQSFATAGLKE